MKHSPSVNIAVGFLSNATQLEILSTVFIINKFVVNAQN